MWGLAHGQALTELRTLTGHTDWVYCVKISPDGTKIASCSRDWTVRIWSVQTGEELQTLKGHDDDVLRVAWSPDSRLVASASTVEGEEKYDDDGEGGTLRLWDVVGGTQATQPLTGHCFLGVAWGSSDASLFVSSSWDKTIIVWRLEGESATVMHTLRGHTGEVNSMSLSPDDRFIVSASYDRTVCVWEVATGQRVRVLEGHTGNVTSAAWSHDGKCIVSGSWDKTVCMWEADEQVCVCVWLHMCACSFVCVYVCMHACMYIYIYISFASSTCIRIYVFMYV